MVTTGKTRLDGTNDTAGHVDRSVQNVCSDTVAPTFTVAPTSTVAPNSTVAPTAIVTPTATLAQRELSTNRSKRQLVYNLYDLAMRRSEIDSKIEEIMQSLNKLNFMNDYISNKDSPDVIFAKIKEDSERRAEKIINKAYSKKNMVLHRTKKETV